MALNNPKRSALFIKQAQTLPVAPDGFVEVNTELAVTPVFAESETNRLSGQMNSKETYIDTCRTSTEFLASVNMREIGAVMTAQPEYAELLKVSGFEGVTGADTYTLQNQTDAIARGSARVYMDGQRFDMTNTLVGSTEIVANVGEVAMVNTTLTGYIDSPEATAETNPTVTLNPNGLLITSCADIVTLDGTVIPAKGITFTTNPEITNVYTMGGANGLKSDAITDYGLLCQITFPVDNATFNREASAIEAGTIQAVRVVLGADKVTGNPVNGESVVMLADTARATVYSDTVNDQLLERVLTLRLYDGTDPALQLVTGTVAGL